MVQRKAMDHRSWGADKNEDREYAKALRDHADSGSTVPLVEVEYWVEVTGDTISSDQIGAVHRIVVGNATYNRDAQAVSPACWASDDQRRCVDIMADIHNLLKERGYL